MNSFDKMIPIIMNEDLEVRRFPILNVSVNDNESQFFCLNELSIRSSIIKSFVLNVLIDNQFLETFRESGILEIPQTYSEWAPRPPAESEHTRGNQHLCLTESFKTTIF
ncbi:hypothetical protein [Salinibacillus kushneri]|uniref:hypothetical protein n=1 Tax=Salinibacillus kushneri TaxID=237682 RepID=UPI0015A610F7|nr:hypothetical protein [Salinibacillus kushneri]